MCPYAWPPFILVSLTHHCHLLCHSWPFFLPFGKLFFSTCYENSSVLGAEEMKTKMKAVFPVDGGASLEVTSLHGCRGQEVL